MDLRKQFPTQSFQNGLFEVETTLESYGITTFELLSLCRFPEDEAISRLCQRTNLSRAKTCKIIHEFSQHVSSNTGPSISHLRRSSKIPSGIQTLDDILYGGIPSGSVTEVFGSSGSGKSQFLLQVALKAQLQKNAHNIFGKSIYLSTESALETRRLTQMACSHDLYPQNALENITYIYCQDEESQDHIIFTQLPSKLKACQENEENVTLVIIDSIGHHFRLQESFINNLAYLRNYLGQQELELGKIAAYAYLKSNLESITNKFLRSNSSFRNRSVKRLYLLELYRHLSLLAKIFNVAILITNQVSDLVENRSCYLEAGIDCDPLNFTLQVGSFSGWKERKENQSSSLKLQNILNHNDIMYQSFDIKRRKINHYTARASSVISSQPPKKVPALGYTWAKLVSNKILMWKSYQLRADLLASSDSDLVISGPTTYEGKVSELSRGDKCWININFAKVVNPVASTNFPSQDGVQFCIAHEGLNESQQ